MYPLLIIVCSALCVFVSWRVQILFESSSPWRDQSDAHVWWKGHSVENPSFSFLLCDVERMPRRIITELKDFLRNHCCANGVKYRYALPCSSSVFLAKHRESYAGCVFIDAVGDEWLLKSLCVHHCFHSTGLSDQMLSVLAKCGLHMQATKLSLYICADKSCPTWEMREAMQMYYRNGFRIVKWEYNDDDHIFMVQMETVLCGP